MAYQILYSSKYGATKQISYWIEERLKLGKKNVFISDIKSYTNTRCNTLILATSIYGGKANEDFNLFLDNDFSKFHFNKLVIIGVSMHKASCFEQNQELRILRDYPHIKKQAFIQEVLLGELIYDNLNSEDKEKLQSFYKRLNLSEEKILEKQKPRTLLNKTEVWDFTQKILGENNE